MRKYLQLALIHLICGVTLWSQQAYLDAKGFYTEPYYVDDLGCYAYYPTNQVQVIQKGELTDGYLLMSVLKTESNIKQVYEDGDYNIIPYDRTGFQTLDNVIGDIKSFCVNDQVIRSSVGAIHIHRDNSYYKWFKIKENGSHRFCLKDSIPDRIVFQRLEGEEYGKLVDNENYIQVEVDLNPGDSVFYSVINDVLCPSDINEEAIKSIVTKLKELNYLGSANEPFTITEIRNALSRYQNDNGLNSGFIDSDTLRKLGIQLNY